MGVSGSGKSTVGEALADYYGFLYLDADDFHSEEARAQMASGKPLTDAMRAPWVTNICNTLNDYESQGTSCTLAFSGLRKAHREQLRKVAHNVLFVYLTGSKETILARMQKRENHYMPASLLDSQFDSMEDSACETDIIPVDITPSIADIIEHCKQQIDQRT